MTAALLLTALLFGGMTVYSFGFAAFLLTALPAEVAGPTIRRAFPHFYLFVIFTSALAAAMLLAEDPVAAGLLAALALTTIPTRQLLMPAINRATDNGAKLRFELLHSLSVAIALAHISVAAYVLTRWPEAQN